MATWSNGNWILLITNETINSNKFVLFLNYLFKSLEVNHNFGYEEVLLAMDNWKYHKSSITKHKLKERWHKVFYLPPYTPHEFLLQAWSSHP